MHYIMLLKIKIYKLLNYYYNMVHIHGQLNNVLIIKCYNKLKIIKLICYSLMLKKSF